MKVAVIGTGRTGSEVVDMVSANDLVGPFNSSNPPTVEALQDADVVVVFVVGEVMEELVDLLIESKKPVVTGATAWTMPDDLEERLKAPWVVASNFSLGVALCNRLIEQMSHAEQLFDSPSYSIHEVHHTHKFDAPSGTAKNWKECLNKDAPITWERKGDVVGTHQMLLATGSEEIVLQHRSKSRRLFAEGALWAAKQILFMPPELYHFEALTDRLFEKVAL